MCVREREREYVCVRERDREREREYVCVRERETINLQDYKPTQNVRINNPSKLRWKTKTDK